MTTAHEDFAERFDVSRETLDRLTIYEDLLRSWNPKINLVAKSTLPDLWSRHFVDSAQIFDLCPPEACSWADLGSGGGFPGLVVAILASEKMPSLAVTLVESDARKCAFLRSVIREGKLNATVKMVRIEELQPLESDVISARALAPLSKLLEYTERHRRKDGTALFLKGKTYQTELSDSLEKWQFEHQKKQSLTDPASAILVIGELSRV